MNHKSIVLSLAAVVLGAGVAVSGPDKNAVKVPGGLGFAEFKGYESWAVIAISESNGLIAVILGNQAMIDAYKKGIPGNGTQVPDGARMAKVHWKPKKDETVFGAPIVPGVIDDVDFMVKDSKRFADSGGWGWAAFEYDAPSDTFRPANETDKPPQAHDAKCGFACHTKVKDRDYVFTSYAAR